MKLLKTRNNKLNHKRRVDNTSGVNGVWWRKDRNRWAADIKVNGKKIWLGQYIDFFEAVCARKSANVKYGFNESHGE